MNSESVEMRRYFLLSLLLHVGIFIYAVIKTAFFPSKPIEYIPSIRVDLVGLPDLKKNEEVIPKPAETEPETKTKAQTKTRLETEDDGEITLSKKKGKKESEAEKRRKEALSRIKALERVKALAGTEIKGNQINKGTALTGAALESLEANYLDQLRNQVQIHWELPKWLRDQNLSAQVVVRIDRIGKLKSLRFLKPSGNEQFDSEVRQAVTAAAPFSPPPAEIARQMSGDGIILGFPL